MLAESVIDVDADADRVVDGEPEYVGEEEYDVLEDAAPDCEFESAGETDGDDVTLSVADRDCVSEPEFETDADRETLTVTLGDADSLGVVD